jgi:cation diffusion facilitator family transporter
LVHATILPAEQRREHAIISSVTTGLLLGAAMLATGLWSRSLTLFADSIRAILLTSLDCCVLLVLCRIHRHQLVGFEYGHGKLEYVLNLLVAAGLLLASIGLTALAALRLSHPPQPPPFGLPTAFVVASVNGVQNLWIFALLRRAGRDGTSIIIAGQLRSRVTKIVSSSVALTAILLSALFQGQRIGVIADLAGTAVVVLVMLWSAFRMVETALPHLLDRMLDEPQQHAINRVLVRHFHDYDDLLFVRTRRSGNTMFVEIGLGYEAHRTIGDVDRINQAISQDLTSLIPGAAVTILASACAAVEQPGQLATAGLTRR